MSNGCCRCCLLPRFPKRTTLQGKMEVVFRVVRDATKPEIKAAVELLFKVGVQCVRTSNVKGKTKRSGRHVGARKNWKAYVSLGKGQEIDFVDGGTSDALIKAKPTSPGRRFVIKTKVPGFTEHSAFYVSSLLDTKKAGRNNTGRVTVRHRGGA